MSPIVHLVRHAEGLHNLGQEHWSLIDPLLTDRGREQCLQLRKTFPFHSNIELVVSSPLSRAIFSAVESFLPVFQSRAEQKLLLLPDLQEIGDFPCDIGSSVEDLTERLKDLNVLIDYSHVDRAWTSKTGRYSPLISAIRARARAVRYWLSTRPEKEIIVVSHGAFLHFLTEDWEDSYLEEATGWKNAEYRTYELKTTARQSATSDGTPRCINDACMTETPESRLRRGKTSTAPSLEEQVRLCVQALHIWEQQGYLRSGGDEVTWAD
ncbi:phosphoglycerate mutase-like protein [Aspergillus ambiguus]|uniref:phosphoglycerate mutase-like protein n=1 Tax=Aspergillus ambiguus TaxID=176160 RepID=UPI003CCDC637